MVNGEWKKAGERTISANHYQLTIDHYQGLGQGKNIGKQHDGAKVQDRDYRCHGSFFSNLWNVKVFHVLDLMVKTFNGPRFQWVRLI
jgi:hypothetical protein